MDWCQTTCSWLYMAESARWLRKPVHCTRSQVRSDLSLACTLSVETALNTTKFGIYLCIYLDLSQVNLVLTELKQFRLDFSGLSYSSDLLMIVIFSEPIEPYFQSTPLSAFPNFSTHPEKHMFDHFYSTWLSFLSVQHVEFPKNEDLSLKVS